MVVFDRGIRSVHVNVEFGLRRQLAAARRRHTLHRTVLRAHDQARTSDADRARSSRREANGWLRRQELERGIAL